MRPARYFSIIQLSNSRIMRESGLFCFLGSCAIIYEMKKWGDGKEQTYDVAAVKICRLHSRV